MKKNTYFRAKNSLDYLRETPKIIYWKVIAGGGLNPIQTYDVVYDDYDYKIRQLVR